ncbi:YqzE family protein [Bacillaceae bacterium Marseille-Q3522]|nr:YqzE family protein [Bacillaceae bacterium Marseille-Q3522]
MKTNDYLKFMTQTFVTYIDKPTEERKEQRRVRKEAREPFLYKWFGALPYAIKFEFRKHKKKGMFPK